MRKLLAAVLAFSSAANAATVAAPVNIGVAAAVRGSVKAAAPGAAGRVVETGKPVYAKDRVTTGPEGKLQILLLDQTSFTIGANSEMVLDEFVYDPNTNAGKVSATIAKGAFRFVTGKVARREPSNMKVGTPVGTIGIRGTIAGGAVDGQEGTFVLLGPGSDNNADEKAGGISVGNEKGSQNVEQDGWGVTVKAGEAPSEPFKLSQSQLDGILGGTGSAPPAGASGSGDDGAGGDSASSSSGEDTAAGKSTAGDAFAAADSAQGDVSQFAAQQFGLPTTAKWADVIAINSGQGTYSGSASIFSCPGGGACSGAAVGTMEFTMLIDFGAKTLGGGSSSISHTLGGSGTIISQSYAGLSGDATKSLTISGGGTWNNSPNFDTTVKLLNAGGVTAGQASIDVRWQTSSGQPIYGGQISGGLQQ